MIATRYRRADAACLLLALCVTACVSAPKVPPAPAPPVPAPPPLDASYDWRGLLLVPFGSVLKEIPFTLHEVLLFRDVARAQQAQDAECYAIEQTPPRFVSRVPSEYFWCFKQDRLARVQATVILPRSEAAQILSDACGLWQRHAAAGVPGTGVPVAAESGACEGRDGSVGYSGWLDQNGTQSDLPMTIDLDAAVQP